MSRQLIVGLAVGIGVLGLLFVGLLVFLLNSGAVSVITNVSSGQVEETRRGQRPVGYRGQIVPTGATGAMTEELLGARRGPPDVLISGGTQVKVTVSHGNAAQIEIIEGREQGMKAWINWDDLK